MTDVFFSSEDSVASRVLDRKNEKKQQQLCLDADAKQGETRE